MTFNIANQITGWKSQAAGAPAVPRLGGAREEPSARCYRSGKPGLLELYHLLERRGVRFPGGVPLLSSNSTTLHLMSFPSPSSRVRFTLIASSGAPRPPPPPPTLPPPSILPLFWRRVDEIPGWLLFRTPGRLFAGPLGRSLSVTDNPSDSTTPTANATRSSPSSVLRNPSRKFLTCAPTLVSAAVPLSHVWSSPGHLSRLQGSSPVEPLATLRGNLESPTNSSVSKLGRNQNTQRRRVQVWGQQSPHRGSQKRPNSSYEC